MKYGKISIKEQRVFGSSSVTATLSLTDSWQTEGLVQDDVQTDPHGAQAGCVCRCVLIGCLWVEARGCILPFCIVQRHPKCQDPSKRPGSHSFFWTPLLASLLKSQTPVLLPHPWSAKKPLTRGPWRPARCSGLFASPFLSRSPSQHCTLLLRHSVLLCLPRLLLIQRASAGRSHRVDRDS